MSLIVCDECFHGFHSQCSESSSCHCPCQEERDEAWNDLGLELKRMGEEEPGW